MFMFMSETDLYTICLLELDLVSRPYKPHKMSLNLSLLVLFVQQLAEDGELHCKTALLPVFPI